jgi:YidC/Oxa1 family membrane protein insertase
MSSAPGGLLPPLDPNPANANSSSTRIMLATTLMFVSWMGFNMLTTPAQKPEEQKPPVENVAPAAAVGAAPAAVATGTSDSLPEQEVKVAVDVKAHAADNQMEGGYEATVSSHGAQLRRFALTGYYETKLEEGQKPGDHVLVDVIRGQHDGARFGAIKSRGGDVVITPDAPYEVTENTPTAVTMSRLTASGVRITRRYTFNEAAFSTHIETTLKNEGTAAKNAELDMLLIGKERAAERSEGGMMSPATDVLGGACVTSEDRETFTSRKVEKDPGDFDFKGSIRAASIDRHYFVGALTFDGVPTQSCTATSWKHDELSRGVQIAVSLSPMPLAPGESKTIAQEAYLGPKQLDALRAFGHGQEEAIDFGFTAVLSRPLLWLLMKIKGVTNDFGLAIIGLTLCIFALALPLTHRSMVEMKKFGKVMKDLKPELDKLKEKYGHDQRLMMEKQQAFFTEKGVNPMANLMGCLPMFISMPIWIALYRMLSTSVELYQQPFHHIPGILDLTQPDVMVMGYPLLPFIVCGLMLVSALQQPPPEDQPQMKYVMYGMPVMFLFIMFNMASGLSIYMITNSLLRMAQSWYIKVKHG